MGKAEQAVLERRQDELADRIRLAAARDALQIIERANYEEFDLLCRVACVAKPVNWSDEKAVISLRSGQFALEEVRRFRAMVERIREKTGNPDVRLPGPRSVHPNQNNRIRRALAFTWTADMVSTSQRMAEDEIAVSQTVNEWDEPKPTEPEVQLTLTTATRITADDLKPVVDAASTTDDNDPATWPDDKIPF